MRLFYLYKAKMIPAVFQFTKTIRHIWTFYWSFLLVPILIDICCLSLFRKYGFSIFFALFWLKSTTLALTFHFVNGYKKNVYYYYFNLGISKLLLWIPIFIFEFIVFVSVIYLANKFK